MHSSSGKWIQHIHSISGIWLQQIQYRKGGGVEILWVSFLKSIDFYNWIMRLSNLSQILYQFILMLDSGIFPPGIWEYIEKDKFIPCSVSIYFLLWTFYSLVCININKIGYSNHYYIVLSHFPMQDNIDQTYVIPNEF